MTAGVVCVVETVTAGAAVVVVTVTGGSVGVTFVSMNASVTWATDVGHSNAADGLESAGTYGFVVGCVGRG